jgi:hypothetical protein
MKTFKTPKGTELPILNLRGKDYLQVMHRLVWFREDRPVWGIETEILAHDDKGAIARAVIKDEQGRVVAVSHKTETAQGFPDFIEKSETGAIGRALALIGYGTQFCADELDEGERIVDSPATNKPALSAVPAEPGSYVVKVGSHKGKRLDQIDQLEGWVGFHSQNKSLSGPMLEAVIEAKKYLEWMAAQKAAK